MTEFIELFTTIYNLSPIPLRVSYGFWAGLILLYWYARHHDKYNVPFKKRELRARNFSAALPFVGVLNVLLYWLAENKKYPWHLQQLFPAEVSTVVGFILMAVGLWIALLGRAAINGFWGPHLYVYENPADRKIIRHGIYAHIRHPIYFGQVLLAYGTFFLANTNTFLLFPVAVTIWNIARARKESAFLFEQYGDEFKNYKDQTDRIIPGVF